ncbi:MAG: UDP-3-O-(3-hydroxymyristoyl)glucosamine N-acyltransferase [Hydrogenophilales bacterium CG_4_9_14_3_um_filter_59_35]|nr:MAG: UDP-3-O-(3-hydroxymyristoyl)glucosamine N-acyltransferase [Hydrogenophilales bacterium CG18_big_fil_WC_8_21_14_2_50_58_12]PIY00308.1 MAG: UDP-3-O-(3-hydroxymyristoyl)glucosamine N-acyltransferase [Hydrogenophilales bacterium CG_4_10_14_3_um_filter_58_23]PJB05187.1 MAG: UDP-3-O-(3-hydroxymyristoyl)glucosamine N-acyltransferase [Hydrogenophilales bacterium CG_4_9_14_3_um_filter_59_35]
MTRTDFSYTLGSIVERFGGELVGDADVVVNQVAPLSSALSWHISFLSNPKYRRQLQNCRAGAVIMGVAERDATDLPRILSDNPHAYFAKVSALLNPRQALAPGIHSTAIVDQTATIPTSATIGAFVFVGAGVKIGEHVVIGSGCHLGEGVEVGDDSLFYPQVVIYQGCVIGKRAILHSGAVIGADGFGLAMENGCWIKVPQIGRVVIGDDVEIGANTTVDRGAMDDTIIENGVKLDNQIQVAHNVHIGAHTAIAGCVGIAGSAKIGKYCTVGGSGMILGHLEIVDRVNISAGTLVTKSIAKAGTYTSVMPFSEHQDWLKNAAHLRHLDKIAEKLSELEKKISELERKKP